MPATLGWIQRPHIVRIEYSGEVTAQEILQIAEESIPIVERHPTYFLVDVSGVLQYPSNIVNFVYRHAAIVRAMQHPNSRAVALVNPSYAVRLATEIVMRNRRYSVFEDQGSALAYLRSCLAEDQADPDQTG